MGDIWYEMENKYRNLFYRSGMQSHECYLYSDTNVMIIDLVIMKRYPFYSEHVISSRGSLIMCPGKKRLMIYCLCTLRFAHKCEVH